MAENQNWNDRVGKEHMSDLNPKGIPVMLDGVERDFLFTLSCIDEIQSETGKPIQTAVRDILKSDAAGDGLAVLVTILINRGSDQSSQAKITKEEVEEDIDEENRYSVMLAVLEAYARSLPEPDEFDTGNAKGNEESDKLNIARLLYIGAMKMGYTEKEILAMTPRKFFLIYDQFLEINGLKEKEVTVADIF